MNLENKKILIVTALGGFIRGFLGDDIRILQKMGYEVHCAANMKGIDSENYAQYTKEYNIRVHQIDFQSANPICKDNIKSFKQIKELIDSENFEAIHIHTPIAGFITRIAASGVRKKGTKIIYTTHGFNFHKGSSKKSWIIFYTLEKIASRFTDAIITINMEDFNNAKKMKCKKVYHINGVGVNTRKYDTITINRDEYREKLGFNKTDIVLLSIGELSKRKNQLVVLQAIKQIKNSNIVFAICGRAIHGEGTYEELNQYAKENNVNLKFLGFRHDIAEICHCADIGILTSTREGLGLAGIEMLASGLPLVTSNVHGIKDYMIDGETGFMYNPYDYCGIAHGITKLLDENLRKSIKSNSIKMAKKFDITISHKQRVEIYKKELV